jgi:hypothetical protein
MAIEEHDGVAEAGSEEERSGLERTFSRKALLQAGWAVPVAMAIAPATAFAASGAHIDNGNHTDTNTHTDTTQHSDFAHTDIP